VSLRADQNLKAIRYPTWAPAGADDFGDAVSLSPRALSHASTAALAMAVAGFCLVTLKVDYLEGLNAARHVVSLNPRSSFVSVMAGSAMVWIGDYDAGIVLLNKCIDYGPKEPRYFIALNLVATAELLRGRSEARGEAGQRTVTPNPGSECGYWLLVAAQSQVGHMT